MMRIFRVCWITLAKAYWGIKNQSDFKQLSISAALSGKQRQWSYYILLCLQQWGTMYSKPLLTFQQVSIMPRCRYRKHKPADTNTITKTSTMPSLLPSPVNLKSLKWIFSSLWQWEGFVLDKRFTRVFKHFIINSDE